MMEYFDTRALPAVRAELRRRGYVTISRKYDLAAAARVTAARAQRANAHRVAKAQAALRHAASK